MYVYLLKFNGKVDYDSYDSHAVIAASEEDARAMVPCADECRSSPEGGHGPRADDDKRNCVWRNPERTTCERVGTADHGRGPYFLASSFNAG